MRNTSGTRLSLSPCPSYTEYLGATAISHGKPPFVEERFYLNCAAARQIPARGAVTFAMRIPVPAISGQAKYDWQLQDTNVASAGIVPVRGSSPSSPAPPGQTPP